METSKSLPGASAPWHLWVVGILSLLWNGIGAFDYVMTETRNASYMSSFTPEQVAYFYGFPAWAVAAWAFGVWGGVLGSILLLLRKRLAVPVFALSVAGIVVSSIYQFALSSGLAVAGREGAIFTAVIFVVAVLLMLYARRLARSGILR